MYVSGTLNMARDRCIFVQCPVRPDFIVIARVRFRILAQRHLAQDNDAIPRIMRDRSDQAFGYAIKPKFKKFAVNTWRAPRRIFAVHPPDKYAQLLLDLRSSSQRGSIANVNRTLELEFQRTTIRLRDVKSRIQAMSAINRLSNRAQISIIESCERFRDTHQEPNLRTDASKHAIRVRALKAAEINQAASPGRDEMTFRIVTVIVAACAAALSAFPVVGQTVAPEKTDISIAVGGKTFMIYLPLSVTERLGYFKEAGLNVRIEEVNSGTKSAQALVGGSVDATAGSFDHTIQLQAKGQIITSVVLMGRYPGIVFGLVGSQTAQYQGPQDLKGMKIGVTAPGSQTNLMVNYIMGTSKNSGLPEFVRV